MTLKHTHQYIRVRTTRDGKFYLFRCAHEKCTHREEKKFLEGRLSLCNKCGAEFKLTNEDLKRARPVCTNCSNTKEAKHLRLVRGSVKTVLGSLFDVI